VRANERALVDRLLSLERMGPDGIPILGAVAWKFGRREVYADGTSADGGWRTWCRYCKVWHHHGAGPGHRVAHCFDHDRGGKRIQSPYRQTGYILVLADRLENPDTL